MGTYIIIKSFKPAEPNWDGVSFGTRPAKIYTSFEDATSALKAYWFGEAALELNKNADQRPIKILQLTEEEKNILLAYSKIRW